MSSRGKRVLVYTVTLLLSPLPVMPFEKGTRVFVFSLMICGSLLALGSLYAAHGELKLKARSLLGNKILAASTITLLFGLTMIIGSIVYMTLVTV